MRERWSDMSEMTGTTESIALLNQFLCDEISAEAAYQVSADRLARGSDAAVYLGLLRQLQEEHGLAAEAVQEQIRALGGEPANSSGPLGVWGNATHCATPFFGTGSGPDKDGNGSTQPSALECLRRGEVHNLENYQGRLAEMDPSSAQLLNNLLIPAQRRHVHVLDELMGNT